MSKAGVDQGDLLERAQRWFAARGQQPFAFQREVWAAMLAGRSGLVHATTGSGKTYAVWIGALARAHALRRVRSASPTSAPSGSRSAGLEVVWITPMRALASDTAKALREPLAALAPSWSVAMRTGDTPSSERAKQDRQLPPVLVTTPESLTLMLTRDDARAKLEGVHTVIADEWHELLGSKRGVQLQLALARLRRWNPGLVAWGLSATLGNLDEAMTTLAACSDPCLVRGRIDKTLAIDTLVPAQPGHFTWAGHLGAQMQQPVVEEIERSQGTTLVFTNVRSQAEIWYQLLLAQRPEWAGQVALHHGSLDREVRDWVETALKEGRLKAVVATSSLDLGVDFLPVERVLQIGSAKGVARLLQRAGRSGHAPGRASRVTLVPTHAFELIEAAAARRAALAGQVESRASPRAPLDVLVQHLVTIALGGGFEPDAMFDEVRAAPAYASLSRQAFDWALAFVSRGGESLTAYPEYHRARPDAHGVWRVDNAAIAKRHRMQVGTIVAEASMLVKWLSGGTIGSVEEGFVARLSPGDHFVFAGRVLELVRVREMTAYVRKGTKAKGIVPAWAGSKMSLSNEMSKAVLALVHASAHALQDGDAGDAGDAQAHDDKDGVFAEPEMAAVRGMLETQVRLSRLPREGQLLVERHRSREGHHVFLYPFAGRNVHIGLAQLLAWRLSREKPNTFSLSVNDHGLELMGAQPIDLAPVLDGRAWSLEGLAQDIVSSLGAGNLARKRFREIARIAGLVFGGYPGQPKSARQLQASSSLFFDVFRQYDADNRLLEQAHEEVLAQELELERMKATLHELASWRIEQVDLLAVSPFALPLMVERFREELSTEKLADRLARIVGEAQAVLQAGEPAAPSGGGTGSESALAPTPSPDCARSRSSPSR